MLHDSLTDRVLAWAESRPELPPTRDGLEVVHRELAGRFGSADVADAPAEELGTLFTDVLAGAESDGDELVGALRAVVDEALHTGRICRQRHGELNAELDTLEGVVSNGGVDYATLLDTPGLPPLRLPPTSELADAARRSPWLRRVHALATWVRPGRTVDADTGELGASDMVAAVLATEAGAPDLPPDHEARLRELAILWELALAEGLLWIDDAVVSASSDESDRSSAPGDAVLSLWSAAFGMLCGQSLLHDAVRAGRPELPLSGAVVVMPLFQARGAGVGIAELGALVRTAAEMAAGIAPERLRWEEWVSSQGDPGRVLVERLRDLGAVDVDAAEVVRLTPLGQWVLWRDLSQDIEIPLLPPAEEMTASDVVAVGLSGDSETYEEEWRQWRAHRSPEAAARALVSFATTAEPPARFLAMTLVARLGSEVEDVWRELLADPVLGPYAKAALVSSHPVGGDESPDRNGGWNLADADDPGGDLALPDWLADTSGEDGTTGREHLLDALRHLNVPGARVTLAELGNHHPQGMAKADENAAFGFRDR